MYRKHWFILIIIILATSQSFAGFWDDVGECFSNPCNCGHGTRYERWNGKTLDKGPENINCPPWNKSGGRGDNICTANTEYPANFVPWHLVYCAETTSQSNYFSPKIRVRYQSCNIFACWGDTTTLNWDGECVIWPSGYAIPMLRICARIAVPEKKMPNLDPTKPDRIFPADPGYTRGKHLNSQGATEDDEEIVLVDGTKMIIDRPKLCAYKDPSAYDFITGTIDFMDYKPLSQPIHKGKGIHPIAQVIIFFIDMLSSTAASLGELLGKLLDSIGGLIIPGLDIFEKIFDFIGEVIKFAADVFEALIRELGQFNRAVDDYNFGCVEIPLGPYPPPYCPTIPSLLLTPLTQPVCPMEEAGLIPIRTSRTNKCVISTAANNAIRNTIRIAFDNFIPLCKGVVDPWSTDKCVTLSSDLTSASASILHTRSARRDIIPKCSSSSSTGCIQTRITPPPTGNFRIVYGLKTGSTSVPINYYIEDSEQPKSNPSDPAVPVPDCGSGTDNATCQEIWGVNIGDFTDVSLSFPSADTPNNISSLTAGATLKDKDGTNRNFTVSIVRKEVYDSSSDFTQTPQQICVFEGSDLIGCEERVAPPKPLVYSCSSGAGGVSCTDNYFRPQFIAQLKSGADSTSVAAEAPSVHATTTPNTINLGGYNYEPFATDDNYIMQPFSGPKSFNPSSMHGNYVDNKAPYDASGNPVSGVVYLNGLEYVNGKYIQGAKFACLKIPNLGHCPVDQKMCVLAKLLNNNIVKCTDFLNASQKFTNLHLCTPTDTSCVPKDSIPGINGNPPVVINECPKDSRNFCYSQNYTPISPSDQELCKISSKASDREKPEASLGNPLSDSQYFQATINVAQVIQDKKNGLTITTSTFDPNLQGLRDKTPVEMGLCVAVTQPKCAAISLPSPTDGGATWPETNAGEIATGTCVSGTPSKPLTRYCLVDAENRSTNFANLPAGVSCIPQTTGFTVGVNNIPRPFVTSTTSSLKTGSTTLTNSDPFNPNPQITTEGVYYIELEFYVPNVSQLKSLIISNLRYDDYILIKVNNNKAFSGPDSYNDISETNGLPDNHIVLYANDINLKNYIQNGKNIIRIEVRVAGGGILEYQIDYELY